MRKTFTKVYPPMTASIQNAAVYNDTEILFDWHKVEGFKGNSIDNIKVIIRGTNGADQAVATTVGLDLLFATNEIVTPSDENNLELAPSTLGTEGGVVNAPLWFNNLVGFVNVTLANNQNDTDLVYLNIANVDMSGIEIPVNGDLYVAAISKGEFDFRTTVQVAEDGFAAGTQTVITLDTAGAKVRFASGDVIHAADNAVLGTVKSVDSDTQITLTSANVDAIADDDVLYNVSPIQLILGGSY